MNYMTSPKHTQKEPTLDDLIQARDKCARVIAQFGEKYLPIFERLEAEIALMEKRKNSLQKALLIGTRNSTQNGTRI